MAEAKSSEKPCCGHDHKTGGPCGHESCEHDHSACEHDHQECAVGCCGHDHETGGACGHDHSGVGHDHSACGHDHSGCDHEHAVKCCGHDHETGGPCGHEKCTHDHSACEHDHQECAVGCCGHETGGACGHDHSGVGHDHSACSHDHSGCDHVHVEKCCGHDHETGGPCGHEKCTHDHSACEHDHQECAVGCCGHDHETGGACGHDHSGVGHDHSACGHDHSGCDHVHVEKCCGHNHETGGPCGHARCDHDHNACDHDHKDCATGCCGHDHEKGGPCGHDHSVSGHHHSSCGHDHSACGHDHGAKGHDHSSCGHDHSHSGHGHDHACDQVQGAVAGSDPREATARAVVAAFVASNTHTHSGHGHAHSSCGHDHSHNGHAHDHSSCGHDHSASCGHDHSHSGHGHDHGDCCGHDHGPPPTQQHTTRPAEDGGWACQFRLADLLPGETDEHGRTEKLVEELQARAGITRVHVRRDQAIAELCVHYEPGQIGLEEAVGLARMASAHVASRYQAKSWFVRGMDSSTCAAVVEHILTRSKGVIQANVSYAAERVVIEYDTKTTNLKQLEARVRNSGYELEEPQKGHACSCHAHGSGLAPLLEMPLCFTAGFLLVLGGLLGHFQVGDWWLPNIFYGLSMLCGGFFAVRGAWNSAWQGRLDIEALMILAAVGAGLLGKLFEGGFLLFLFSLAHALEHRAMEKARKSIESLTKLRPENALRKRGDTLETIPIGQLLRGDRVLIRPGDRVPIDGVVREGISSLDQAAVTGESVPVTRGPGESVFAGTVNVDGTLEVEVTRLSGESVLARVVDMVAEAEARKGPSQLFARRVEQRFVPIALAGAPTLTLLLWLGFHMSLPDAVLRGISVLVAASPCALAIATPAAVLSAVARAAKSGVLIKGGSYLEALGNLNAVAFDKTGTLTEGKPKVVVVQAAEGVSEQDLLSTAAALENQSSHPLARAIVEEAGQRNFPVPLASQTRALLGKGLSGQLAGESVQVGSLSMFEGQKIPQWVHDDVIKLQESGRTAVVVERAGKFLGILGLADVARKDAVKTIKQLRGLGVEKTIMLSGDNLVTARAVAGEVGVDEVRAPLMPEDKVHAVRELAKQNTVAMIGDGVNDAPALASASIGVAMGGAGSDVALETADVVLMGDSLESLPFAVELARESVLAIKQNLFIALGVSAVLVVSSCVGAVNISQAVVLHEGSTLLVVGNGLRLLLFKSKLPVAAT